MVLFVPPCGVMLKVSRIQKSCFKSWVPALNCRRGWNGAEIHTASILPGWSLFWFAWKNSLCNKNRSWKLLATADCRNIYWVPLNIRQAPTFHWTHWPTVIIPHIVEVNCLNWPTSGSMLPLSLRQHSLRKQEQTFTSFFPDSFNGCFKWLRKIPYPQEAFLVVATERFADS
jgi:hypothetical protein